MFLQNDILKQSANMVKEVNAWRTETLWTLEINEVFKVNLKGI